MSLKAKVRRLFQRPIETLEDQGDATWCPGCHCKVPLHHFHHIPDMVALKAVQDSIVRNSATSGELCIPGRYAIGEQYGSFIYCEDCHKTLSLAQKKELVWYLCARSADEAGALRHLERGRHLCVQIDKGL